MNQRFRIAKSAILLLTICTVASPALGDWLVTHDGHRVETRGEWRVEGSLVLFELPTGGLVSMRASEVDLEASRAVTAEMAAAAQRAPESASEKPRPAVYSLTDADVGHITDEDEAIPEGDEDPTASPAVDTLAVIEWTDESDPDGDGVQIEGLLTNRGDDTRGNIRLVARLYDVEGRFIASSSAELTALALPPGESARFEAVFPGIFDYSGIRFETEGIGFVTADPAPEQTDDDLFEENET